MRCTIPGSALVAVLFACAVGTCAGRALAGTDPDVDDALAILKGVDGLTKEEAARYEAALAKYAEQRQKLLGGMGKLVEADQPEVDGAWDQLCDEGLRSLADLVREVPAEKTMLKKFFECEAATWEALKKVDVPAAEEAESRTRKAVETILPVVEKKLQEIKDEDRKLDEDAARKSERRKKAGELIIAALRVINKAVNPNDILKAMIEEVLVNHQLHRAALLEMREAVRAKRAMLKAYKEARQLTEGLNKALEAGNDDMLKKAASAKDGLKRGILDSSKGVAAHAALWTKLMDAHFAETIALLRKFNDANKGQLLGDASNETKDRLGDLRFFTEEFSKWEEEAKAIEEGLDALEKRIDEFRDGDLKTKMKDNLSRLREIARDCASLRSDIRREYEDALGDAGLK